MTVRYYGNKEFPSRAFLLNLVLCLYCYYRHKAFLNHLAAPATGLAVTRHWALTRLPAGRGSPPVAAVGPGAELLRWASAGQMCSGR